MPIAGGLNYELYGDETAPLLLLSAGLDGLASSWETNLTHLREDYRVLVYDHRGTGESFRDVPGRLSVESLAEDIALLIDGLELTDVAFVGHGLGGLAGLALEKAQPGRLASILVVNGWAGLDPQTARCLDARQALLRAGERAFLAAEPLWLYPPAWNSERADQLLRDEVDALQGFPGAEMMERRIDAMRGWEAGFGLGGIGCPVMLLTAEDDLVVPTHCTEALKDAMPQAKVASLSHGGHGCHVTRPEDFANRLREFIG